MTKASTCFVRRLFLQSRLARRCLPSYSSVFACSHTTKYLPPPKSSTSSPIYLNHGCADTTFTCAPSDEVTHPIVLSKLGMYPYFVPN